jgi:hypothetical protein
LSPVPARDRYSQFRVNKATKQKHLPHGSSCIALAAGGRSANVPYVFTVHNTTFTWHRATDRRNSEGADGRGDRYAQRLEPKFGGTGRAAEPCLSVCTEACRAVHLQIPSFHPVVTAIRGEMSVIYCHTKHCFSALGVWPPFSLTCISLNQGLVNGSFFVCLCVCVCGGGESWVIFPKACLRNCENGRVFSSLS